MSKVQLKDVYNGMKNVGWSVPDTYEKFEKYMTSGPNGGYDHRKEVYDKMKGAGWSVPNTYEQFSKSLFAPTKSASGGGAGSHSALARPQNRDAAGARFKTPMPKILDKGLDGAFGGDTGTGAVGGAETGAASGEKVFENPDEATYIFPNSYKKEAAKRVVEYRKRGYDDASIERKLELEGLTDAQIKNRLELDWARSFDDGTKSGKELSQKLVASHFHKRLSDINALHFGDGGSASAGNGYGAGSNVNGHDRGGNGGVGADDVAAKTWEQALTRVNAEVGRFDELTGGMPSLTASAMPRAGLTEVSRMREFDLNRLMDDHWANLGESGQKSYIADCKRYLMEIGRDAELIEAFEAGAAGKGYSKVALNAMVSRQLDKEAEALAREQSDIHMFEYAKKQNLPKGKLEFFARKIASANTAVQLTKGLARAVTGHSGDMAASEAAMAEYGSEHGVLDLAGMVGGMTLDPVTWVSGSVGGGASKAVVNLVGKRIAGKGASSLARKAAARQFGASLKGSLVAGVSGGGTNFALFEGLNEAKNQFMHGGHVVAGGENDDIRTQLMGKNEGYSLESIGKQMVRGAVMGGVGIGWLHPVSGNVSDKLVRGLISGTFGKMVARAGVFTGATVLEGTIFSVPEWLEGERDKWDVWKDNMAMMAAFKFKPAAKAVGYVAREAGSEAVYSAAKRLGKIGSTPQGRASMETRLRTWLDRPSMPMSLTADERKELRDGGYDFSYLLHGVESEAQLREHGASNAGKGLADSDGADNGRDTRGAELTKELQRLVDDGSISESARAKMYYYATGNFLPVSTIGYGESVENGDGTYTVRSYGENGVVTSRTFKSERAARLELGRVERQAEMNQVSVGEQNVLAEERDKRLEGAMRKVAAKKGMSITSFANLLDGPEDASKDTAEAKEVRKQIWREISEELKGMPLPRLNRVEEIRHGVEVKCGAQVYDALSKEPERRSERERRVVSEYIRELQHVEDVEERAVAGGADNAEVAESEVRPMGKARARIGIEYADVEVLSGDVVLDASGGIDRDKSSKTVVVRDLRDGRKLTVETKKLSGYSPAEKMEGKESEETVAAAGKESLSADPATSVDVSDEAPGMASGVSPGASSGDAVKTGGADGGEFLGQPVAEGVALHGSIRLPLGEGGEDVVCTLTGTVADSAERAAELSHETGQRIDVGDVEVYVSGSDGMVFVKPEFLREKGSDFRPSRQYLEAVAQRQAAGDDSRSALAHPQNRDAIESGGGRENRDAAGESKSEKNGEEVSESDGKGLTLQEIEKTQADGNGPEQNNDESAESSGDDGGSVAGDSAGGVASNRDRGHIRVYEEGLEASYNEHSGDGERARRNTEGERLIGIAKEQGEFKDKDEIDSLGERKDKRGGESEVFIDRENGKVYKVKDPYAKSPMKGNVQPEDAVFEHLVHNKYFPETAYGFEGVSEELGDVRIVLSQDYVEAVDKATDEQVAAALAEKGLYPEGKYRYGNDEVSVTDVTGDNALVGADGKVYFIDPIIDFKKPVREILGDKPVREKESALSRIPVDRKGKPDFAAAESAELGFEGMVEMYGDGAAELAESAAQRKEAALKKERAAKVKPPKLGDDATDADYLDAEAEGLRQKKERVAALEEDARRWRAIADVPKSRAEAEKAAVEKAEAEKAEVGRRANEEAQARRRASARKIMVKRVTAEEYAGPKLSDEKDYYGKPLVLSKNGTVDFGVIDYESGLTEAPIRLSLGENRKDSEGKNHGYGLLHIEAGHGEQIRNAGYSSVEEFVEDVAKNYTDIREGAKIGDNQTYLLEVSDEHNNTLFIQMSRDGSYWNVNSAGIFKKKYSRRKPKVYDRPAVSNGKGTDTIEVNSGHTKGATAPAGNSSETSEYKDNIKNSEKQAEFEKAAAEELADREAKAKLDKLVRHVFDEVKDVPEALERLEQTSIPEDIYEVAAMVLSRYKLLARSNDGSKGVMADTGIGEGERKRLFRMFMPKEKGGKSLGWLAGDAMKELCEQYGIHYDNQDAHNALIEMLQNAKVPSDIYNYIVNNRIEEARKIAGDYHNYIAGLEDAWCQETFGMSREEYMEMREVQEEEARKALEDLDYDEYNAILAEEKLREEEYEQRRFEQVDPSAEGEGSGGGGTLLPDQGTDKQGGGGGIAQEPGGGSVAVGEGVGDAQGLPEGSSGRGSLSKESGEGDGPKYRGGDAELAHGARLAVHHEGDEWWVDVPGYEGRATSRKDMMDSLRARFPQYGFVPTLDGKGVVVNHPDKPVANGSDVVLSHGQELRVEPAGEPRAGYDGKPHYTQCTHPLLPGRVFDGVYELAGALEASFPGWRAEAWPDGRISMWHVQDLDRGRAEKTASAGRGVGSRGFERGRMLANAIGRTHSMAQRLGLPVDYVMSEELPEGELRGKKGWYDPKTGRITVVVDNHGGEGGDLLRTLLHEGVGHRGLRAMFGEHFDDFLDAVYENGDDYVHSRIDEYMRGEGGDRRRATEEYLATLAEDNHVSQPWIRRVCKLFFEMLDSVGLLRVAKGVTLSDADLRYLLWRSHQNLVREAAREDVSVRDAEMQRKLGLDRPDIAGDMESAGGDVKLPGSHVESIASEPSLFDAEQSSLFAPEDFGISESKVVKGDASDGMASGGRPSASHSTKADGKALAGASDGNGKGDGMARARISELARGDNEGPLDYAARVSAEYEAALDSERDAEIRADVERMELDLAERVPEDPDEVRGEIGELQSMWEELAFRHGEEPHNEEVRELMGAIETAIATRKRIDFVLAEGGGSASEEASRSALTQPQNRDATGGGNIMPSSEVNKTDGVGKDGVGKEGVGGSGSKAGGSGGIDDWGEEIYGARKNALRDLSKQLSGVTAADLVANPVSKVFKPKDWVKLAAKGEITAEDARVLEAMTRLILRDKKPSGLSRNRYASRRREEEIKAWAERTAKLMDGLRRYAEAGTAEDRAAALESMDMRDMEAMRDRRAQVLEWNPDRKDGGHYEPNELETVIDIMDGMDVPATPFGKAKLPSIGVDSFGSRFEVSLDGKYKRSFGSYEEALAYSVKLAKVSRGDMDVEYMPEDFVPYVTSYKEKELDTWSVMYLTGRRGDFAFKDGLSEAEATKLKANLEKKGVACNMRHEKVNEPTGWKLRVRDPLSGERYEIEGCPEFADKSEASAWLDANIGDIQEKANAAVSSAYAPKEKVERHLNLEIGYDRESGTYDVWLPLKKKTAYGNMLTFARGFATRKEAAEWIERNRAEIDAWDAARKEARRNFRYFTPGNVREGRDWRSGKDVSEREVGETFGFRGVQFGNWTNQRDRQQAVNEAYDALMDLADVLGVSPKAIGLGGELGLAFGARGSGNANAHYERDNVVINLTKTRGAGSLAHEWWHALDNYYSRRGGIKTGMMTDGASAEIRAEMGRAFRGLVEAISGSDYDARSRDMGSYWGSPVEETARLFAEWVHMKLKDMGRRNSFLSNGLESSDAERWQQMTYGLYKQRMKMVNADIARANEKLKDGEKKPELEVMSFEQWQKERESLADYPYPTEAELRERFNEPMQRLVDTMEEKSEGDGSVVLYRLGDPRETFAERQKKAVENRGTVMRGLNEAEVEVIEVPRHGYRGTAVEAKNQAVKDAKQRFDGKVFTYNNNGIRFEYTISGSSLDKTMSRSSIQNSANMGVHIAVLNSIDKVIGASIEVEEHPDYIKDNNGQRKITNDINPELLIHRFVGAVKIDGRLYSVRTVIKEYRNTRSQANYYTYEVSDVRIEAQPSKESRTSAGVPKSETPSLASAKVTKESDTSNRQSLNFDDESGSSEEAINIEVSEGKPSDTSTGSGRLPKESPGRTANLEKESEISKQNLEKSLVEGDKKDVRAKVRVADLINDLGKTYDSGKKILEESRKADAEVASRSALTRPQNRDAASEDMHRDVNAEGSPSESLEGRRARAEELSDRFGVGVEVVSSLEELRESEFYKGLSRSERRALERRKGAYDPRTGRVIVLAHNHRDADDVSETVFHEVVAHKGLRELVGKERFSEFCDEVYGHLRKGLRKEVGGMATRLFMDSLGTEGAMTIDEARRVAVDELFGRLAEKGFEDFTAEERGVWGKLKQSVLNAINRFLGTMGLPKWVRLGDNELRYILWRSHENLREGDYVDKARDIAKREELGLGDGLRYSETKEERQLREVNDRFNQHLDKLAKGEMANGELKLGRPGETLRNAGIDGEGIYLQWNVLQKKMNPNYKHNHPFLPEDVKNLPEAINNPIAVFESTGHGDFNILVDLEKDGKNFIVSLEARRKATRGGEIEIEDVVTLYPKEEKGIIYWINRGLGKVYDKEKALQWLRTCETHNRHSANEELRDAAKIIENFENPKDSEGKIRFRDGDDVEGGVSENALAGFDERKLGLRERITNAEILLSILNEGNVSYRKAAVESIRKNLGTLRSAMAAQKRFDRVTVKQVTDLAQVLIKNGYMDGLRGREVRDLLTAVRNATGKDDISAQVHRVMEIMVDSQLREGENLLHKVLKIKAQKVDKDGIVKQGAVDADTADMLHTYKLWRTSDIEKIDAEIAAVSHELAKLKEERKEREEAAKSQRKGAASEEETSEKGNVEKKSVAEENLEKELEGLMHAFFHADKIVRLEKEEARMRREMREADESYTRGDMTLEKRREFKKNAKEAIWENKIARIEAYAEEAARIGEMTERGRERALAFREAERERVGRIRHMANSDMEGRSERIHNKKAQKLKQWMVNNTFSRFIFAPLSSFDMMLRTFGKRSVDGEGYLWNHFMGGWKASRDKEISGHMAKMEELDVFVKSLTGDKRARWSNLIKLARNKGCEVDFLDGKEKRTEELTQGNLMYIYMANKMVDGKMKLRKMGIGESDVERISEVLDPNLKKAADWLQEEFLPKTREEYNETHKRMFGTSMDDIENYFPLRILGDSLQEKGGVDDSDSIKISNGAGATKTGAINRRTVNARPLDILNSDATHIILDHIEEMEHWNAFAEWGRDVNTLLSDTNFRAKVKNMTTMYGAGDSLWKEFKDCCRLAAGTYRPEVDAVNRGLMNIAKGATGSAVARRLYTAMKQLTSWPAYIGECNPFDLAKSTATSWKSLSWAMENVPMIRERWKSRVAGDPRLSKLGTDWKLWEKKIPKFISQYGMLPNAAVDVWTVAVGAKAMYDTALRRYKKEGYSKEEAHRRAIEKAETYNETQQSDEGAYLSPMQRGGNYLSNLFTIFRNSPFSYTRKTARAARNLGKYGRKGEWERDLEFERKKILRDLGYQGLEDAPQEAIAKAGEAAKKRMVRQLVTDMVNLSVFGLGLSYVWNLGGSAWYLLFGEDGKKKDEMWYDAAIRLLTAPVEGLTGGDMISNVAASLIKGESLRGKTGKSLPFEEELSDIIAELTSEDGMKVPEGINHLVNLAAMTGLGINPRTIEEMVMGIWDGCHGDLGLANGVAITIGRFMNVAPSQLKNMYIDEVGLTGEEASKMSPKEIAELYAARQIARERFITFKWDDEEALARYEKIADKRIKERMESFTPEDLETRFEEADERYTSIRRSQTEARKILDEDNDYMSYGRAMAGIQREAGDDWHRLELYGQLDRELTKTTKAYLKTRDSGEAQELRKRIDDIKERISRLPDMPVEEAMMESLKIKGERQVESAWENMLKRSAMAEAGWEW